ncbi:hypothetical protein [Actinomadura litoris]|uniref:hypothetical protein n=1 Tax=Actinomadura litoris TaxID=2678616 RepID=UPI001FA803BC|nr:hypothetical protein [Actinomadura litoris]
MTTRIGIDGLPIDGLDREGPFPPEVREGRWKKPPEPFSVDSSDDAAEQAPAAIAEAAALVREHLSEPHLTRTLAGRADRRALLPDGGDLAAALGRISAAEAFADLMADGVLMIEEIENGPHPGLPADSGGWAGPRGSDPSRLPGHPRDVERLRDPKPVPDAVRARGGRRTGADYFDDIGPNVSLDALARIPAYADRVAETEEALKGLGYL